MVVRYLAAFTLAVGVLHGPAADAAVDRKAAKADRKAMDHDRVRQAVLRGEVLPLPRILTLASGYQAGEVIEVELESRPGSLYYDVHVLTASGAVRQLFVDARTGKLLVNRTKAD